MFTGLLVLANKIPLLLLCCLLKLNTYFCFMPIKRSRATRFQRSLRLILSDFYHLVTPDDKSVFTWKEIFIWSASLIFLLIISYFAANH